MTDSQELLVALRRVRRRWRTAAGLRAMAHGAAGAAAVVLAAVAAAGLTAPGDAAVALLGIVTLTSAAAFAGWMIWSVRRSPGSRHLARFVEERCPELEDSLASAVDLIDRPAESGPLAGMALADAAARLRQVDLDRVLSRRALWSTGLRAAAAIALLAFAVGLGRGFLGRGVRLAWAFTVPSSIRIEVVPGDTRLVGGRPLRISARVTGVSAGVVPAVSLGSGATSESRPMEPVGDGFVLDFDAVEESFRYRVATPALVSREYRVTVIRPPAITRIDVEYRYPPFTGLPPRTDEGGGDVFAPPGTDVRLRIHTDKPIVRGALLPAGQQARPLDPAAGMTLTTTMKVVRDGSYRVTVTDADGLTNPGDVEYFVRVMDDRPPEIRILRPAADRTVTPLEEVPIVAEAEDDYGLSAFDLVFSVRGGPEQVVRLPYARATRTAVGNYVLSVEDLAVSPGDFVTYYARARDVGRGKRATESRSDIFFLEVTPFEQEFAAAESQAAAGGGQGLDSLVNAQKEIIIATWTLDRRSGSGVSEPDVRALARAQGELRGRATSLAQAASAGTRRRRGDMAAADDPMTKAVEAMARAESALNAIKTHGALPHEMEALSQLMKADAAVRRRQVGRQASGGGGGRGGGQDLSSLFDRELQRQQQTNYENRPRTDDKTETPSEALDKVRELARRQDELNRQQRELAEGRNKLDAADFRRQLDRLTREQAELRNEAQALSKRLTDRDNQRSASSDVKGADRKLRDISEDMRTAATELRRDDPAGASARGGQALDKLRDLERQLGREGPGSANRMLAELQVEARQLADAERQLAGDARRAEKDASGDALRRLAGQQDRLAERASALGEALGRAEGAGPDAQTKRAMREARSDFDRLRPSDQMRAAAEQARGAVASGRTADAASHQADVAQQLARSLDRIAERLESARAERSAESRRLSDQLERVGDLRERLADIERRVEGERSAARTPGSAAGAQGQPLTSGSQASAGSPGKQPGTSASGPSGAGPEGTSLQQQYEEAVRELQEIAKQLNGDTPGPGSTPAEHAPTPSAPGTQAFKQDFARWDGLRRDVKLALDHVEATLAGKLAATEARDRLNTAGDDHVPEQYRRLIARYYESLARKKPDR